MAGISAAELAKINSFPKLVDLLRNHLEWPIEEDYGFEDVVYEYEASELGLKPDEIAKIREIHQLRPLATSQPWGIFFISFEDKALSVTVLRRILKNLILKKRAGAQASDRQAWEKNDLIFAANFGNSGSRELAFVHFSDGAQSRDLPVMKVLGWNARDTQLHNDYVGRTLAEKLRWPDDPKDIRRWRDEWSSAFELRLNEAIRTSKDLALRLAGLATEIRARANELLRAETDRGPMRTMLEAFRKNLIHDLDEDGFADMFAQTIAYGMLAARISRPAGIVADNLADMVPKTNPFLKELFANFLAIGGHDKRQSLDFDELGVRDVVDMLNAANMEAVLRDFGDRNPKEDPVIHFYELFLKEYDPQKRMQRGVFYTPRPVVNFIVRGVDEILRTEFDLPLGLADTSTWAEVAARNDRITIPSHIQPDAPFVQILDPATGTGTFLVEIIDLIYKRMHEHWKEQGRSVAEIKAAWNAYVPAHLLPRLTAFELMMAPYTIAHMKVGLKLSETGYAFGSEERARIFLTNALEPARDLDMEFIFMSEALAHEAQASNDAKTNTPFTVLVGNPPYSKSITKNSWISSLVKEFRDDLGEKKSDTQREEWKFFRLSTFHIARSTSGVVSFIANNAYLDAPTLRFLRRHLFCAAPIRRFLNLHGDANKVEKTPSGFKDENVFDIRQGVGISLLAAVSNENLPSLSFDYGDLWGEKDGKLDTLALETWKSVTTQRANSSETETLIRQNDAAVDEPPGQLISEILPVVCGIETKRDHFALALDRKELTERFQRFVDFEGSDEDIKANFGVEDNDWSVSGAKKRLRKEGRWEEYIKPCSVRPFDRRWVFYSDFVLARARGNPMNSMNTVGNIGIVVPRQTKEKFGAFVVDTTITHKFVTAYDRSFLLPLLEDVTGAGAVCRFSPSFIRATENAVSLRYEGGTTDLRGDLRATFGPRDLLDYIYAVLYSDKYRSRYAVFLKSSFARIPTPKSLSIFAALASVGRQLVGLHLLRLKDAPILISPDIRLVGNGDARVEKGYPEYTNGKVMINPSRWFEDVPKATWEFHVGGYQVCEKWLKDRAGKGGQKPGLGRVLTEEDILHYCRVVVALTETRRLMAEIDVEIDKRGGWPDAFVTGAGGN
jgi:predicted helicase